MDQQDSALEDALLQAAYAVYRRKGRRYLEKQEIHDELYERNSELDRSDPEDQGRVYEASVGLIEDGDLEVPDKSGQSLDITPAGIDRAKTM